MKKVTVKIWLGEIIPFKLKENKVKCFYDEAKGLFYTYGIISACSELSVEERVVLIKTRTSRSIPVILFDNLDRRVLNKDSDYGVFWFKAIMMSIKKEEDIESPDIKLATTESSDLKINPTDSPIIISKNQDPTLPELIEYIVEIGSALKKLKSILKEDK